MRGVSPQNTQQPPHESAISLSDKIEFPLIQPEAIARETLVDANIAESNLFKLHSALRALHEVERTISLPFFGKELRLPLPGHFPHAFDFQAGKVLILTLNTKQSLHHADMMTVGLSSLIIEIAKHDASFKH
jgi:hypothetical protein